MDMGWGIPSFIPFLPQEIRGDDSHNMSAQKQGGKKPNQRKEPEPKKPAPQEPTVTVAKPVDPPPLYRAIDWWTFAITTAVVMLAYWLTLAPDLTLEDSGELAVGSMYAGIPHPPGYPVWTLYTWFFAKFIPFSNIAWRVAFGCALAGALSCGLLGLMVSRGSSMLIEGIESLKAMPEKWENAICLISGFSRMTFHLCLSVSSASCRASYS